MANKKKEDIIGNKKLASIQLWYGENQSLLALEVARWQAEFRKRHPQATITLLEYTSGKAKEFMESLHSAVYGGGLFTEKRLIIIYDVLQAEAKSETVDLIKTLCQEPPAGVFILLIETEKVSWSKPFPSAIRKLDEEKITIREFGNLEPPELEKWIIARAKAEGGNMPSSAARLLAALVGNDFFKLSQEVPKLVAYRGKNEIKAADLDLLVTSTLQDDVFVFVEAVGKRDFKAASAALARQFEQGVTAQSLVGLLAWHLRVLTSVRFALDKAKTKLSSREIASELSLHPYVVTKALQQIPYYSQDRLVWLYSELSDLDVQLKTSRTAPEALFGLFLSKLATLKVVK
jgi:DNA polymerase-3 subunit delta